MRVKSFNWIENEGLFIDGKKYGLCISKLELKEGYIIIYIHKATALKIDYEDFCNPYDLKKYENVKIREV